MSQNFDKKDQIFSDLQELGLSEKESFVYVSLLRLGEVGASKIVKDTGLHGQIVYNSLETLEDKNLARYNLVKGRKRFYAQDPSILKDLLSKKMTAADSVIENIQNKFSTLDVQDVEVIKGQESFIRSEFKYLEATQKGASILILGGLGDSYIKNMGKSFTEYEYQRNKKDVKIKYIGVDDQKDYMLDSTESRKSFQYRFLPKMFSGVINVAVYENSSVSIYLFDETVITISIKNKKVVDGYQGFFDGLWELGEK